MKLLTILDCYIHNETILNKLSEFIDQLKTKGSNILLISNTNIPEQIQKKIDYCLYDTNNNLFSDNWEFLQHNVVKSNIGDCNIEDVFPLFQPHGLSVMINLFNAVQIGKSLGYTHFEKLEYDPLFTESSFNNISKLPSMCLEKNKEGLFLLNDKTTPQDVSFHYFFCNIDFFFNESFFFLGDAVLILMSLFLSICARFLRVVPPDDIENIFGSIFNNFLSLIFMYD